MDEDGVPIKRKLNKKTDTLISREGSKGCGCTGAIARMLAMGIIPTFYMILSVVALLFNVIEIFVFSVFSPGFQTPMMVFLGLEYYLILLPALLYGFHGLDYDGVKDMWGNGIVGKTHVLMLPLTTVLSLLIGGFWTGLRVMRKILKFTTTSTCVTYLLKPLAVLCFPAIIAATMVFVFLLPILWAASIMFKLFVFSPGFYFAIESMFLWAVEEGTPAFRFDSTWRKGHNRRDEKVVALFHPGEESLMIATPSDYLKKAKEKEEDAHLERPDGITHQSVAFLMTFSLLVDFVMGGLIGISTNLVRELCPCQRQRIYAYCHHIASWILIARFGLVPPSQCLNDACRMDVDWP